MKRARVYDYWRRAYQNEPMVELVSVSFRNVPLIGNVEIPLGKGITALTGLNGAGKSTVLHAIWLCLDAAASPAEMALNTRLVDGTASVLVRSKGLEYNLEYSFSDGKRRCALAGDGEDGENFVLDVVLIDTAELAPALQRFVRQESNFNDLVEQVDGYTLNADELELVRYVTGRRYDSVEVYELELGLINRWSELPYFRVVRGNNTYGVEHLGLGELSGLLLFWALNRLTPGSVVLIDEPESFLASHSQVAITDVFAYAASERDIACVLTSHSDNVVSKIPMARRLISIIDGGALTVTSAEDAPNHLSAIGLGAGTRLVAITEDAAATAFLRELITLGAPALRDSIEICWAGSSGEVIKLLNDLPDCFQNLSVKFIGVLDGDQKRAGHKSKCPLLYLPTEEDPEAVARLTAEKRPEVMVSAFGKTLGVILAALAKAEGSDFHDWPFVLAQELGRTHHEILAVTLRAFVVNDIDSKSLEIFLGKIASKEVFGIR